MVRLVRLLQKYATGRVVLVLFILTMVVYLTMLFYSIPAVVSFAPDMTLFDLSPSGYTFDYIENVYIVIMLKSFPDIPSRIVELASLF
ncbi:MAG: hypothetical protein KZQ88_03710, partial [Candidatus Thiodiazotropha sp. (ex Dulcina madagascariensis)]|nr:hypothetical protein [Candidatus Thiodiazotropha sp. (ex Dulcina madagascariensis)]